MFRHVNALSFTHDVFPVIRATLLAEEDKEKRIKDRLGFTTISTKFIKTKRTNQKLQFGRKWEKESKEAQAQD